MFCFKTAFLPFIRSVLFLTSYGEKASGRNIDTNKLKWPHLTSISREITFRDIIAVSLRITKDLMGNCFKFFLLQNTETCVIKHADQKSKIFDTARHTII